WRYPEAASSLPDGIETKMDDGSIQGSRRFKSCSLHQPGRLFRRSPETHRRFPRSRISQVARPTGRLKPIDVECGSPDSAFFTPRATSARPQAPQFALAAGLGLGPVFGE